jgi:hypothetical protein
MRRQELVGAILRVQEGLKNTGVMQGLEAFLHGDPNEKKRFTENNKWL